MKMCSSVVDPVNFDLLIGTVNDLRIHWLDFFSQLLEVGCSEMGQNVDSRGLSIFDKQHVFST